MSNRTRSLNCWSFLLVKLQECKLDVGRVNGPRSRGMRMMQLPEESAADPNDAIGGCRGVQPGAESAPSGRWSLNGGRSIHCKSIGTVITIC